VKKLFSVALISSTLLLTGCGQANNAAQFGKKNISQADIQTSINQIMDERSKIDTTNMNLVTGADLNQNVLRLYLVSDVLKSIAKEQGFEVTKGQIDDMRSKLIAGIGGNENLKVALVSANIASRDFNRYIRTLIIQQALQDAIVKSNAGDPGTVIHQLVTEKLRKLGVKINPRYGNWDFQNGDLVSFDPAGSALVK
jgi:D-alanyl-D-alanine carboxypeptidase